MDTGDNLLECDTAVYMQMKEQVKWEGQGGEQNQTGAMDTVVVVLLAPR